MLDPISLAAATAVLGAVGAGMANEAGKRAWESAGGLVRRIAGREVAAPTTSREAEAVARLVSEGMRRDPSLSHAWEALARQAPRFGAVTGRPQLPPSPRFFTDRKEAIKLLDREAARPADGRPKIALLHGPEGMGTSTLALHWGSKEASRYAHGQLYVDLQGQSTGSALDAAAALSRLLRQLGLSAEDIPPSAEERSAYFRRIASDRELLVVLDHAYSAAQIRPLITSATGLFTLVVARHPLPGLDALRVPVGPLADKDARRLLTDIAGAPATTAARAVLEPVIARCGGSPYALRAAAPRLSCLPLPRHQQQEEEVSPVPDNDALHTAAEDTYRLLDPDAARLYRLLGLRPWPFIGPAAASWAAEISEYDAARILATLAERQLLEGTDDGRYRFRPAVRRHAEQTAARVDRIPACASAIARMTQGYRDTALHAAHHALPESWRVPPLPEGRPTRPAYTDRGQALATLAAEAANIVQAMKAAAEFGHHQVLTDLGRALWPLQLKAGHHDELLPVLQLAARSAATTCPGTRTAGALHAQLAHTLTELRRFEEAEGAAYAATEAEREAGHARGHASATELLGLLRLRQWRFDEAYDCFNEAGEIYDTIDPDGEVSEGAADLPRALALLQRHRGRALRGMGRTTDALQHLESALQFFRDSREAYNTARVLTDLAETLLDQQDRAAALPHIDEAIDKLGQEQASYSLAYLRALREQCLTPMP